MRKQYHFRPSDNGFYAWDVDRLIELTRDTEQIPVKLVDIGEIDESFWFADENNPPTCRAIAAHAKLIEQVELSFPIILSSDGRVMDGMHRVAKALMRGDETILAVRFTEDPEPDYTDVHPDELPY